MATGGTSDVAARAAGADDGDISDAADEPPTPPTDEPPTPTTDEAPLPPEVSCAAELSLPLASW